MTSIKNTYIADVIGLLCLAATMLLGSALLPSLQIPPSAWVFTYLVVAVLALFVWHHQRSPKTPRTWFLYAFYTVLAALLWLAYSRVSAGVFFWNAEPAGSQAFDFALALLISPGLTTIFIIGCVRALAAHP